jgi:hypothetical protein
VALVSGPVSTGREWGALTLSHADDVSSITLLRITVNDSIRMRLCAIGILQTLARRVQSKCGSSPCRSGESPWRPKKIGALMIPPTGVKAVLRTEDAVLSRTAEPANVVTMRMLAQVFAVTGPQLRLCSPMETTPWSGQSRR